MDNKFADQVARTLGLDKDELATGVMRNDRTAARQRITGGLNVEEIMRNLLPDDPYGEDQGAVRLANTVVERGGHLAEDRTGISVNAKDDQEGTGEPDEDKDLDARRNQKYHQAFEKKHPGEARAKMKAFAADRSKWEPSEEAERKSLDAYCDDDDNFLTKSTNSKVYGNTIPDTTTKVYG